MPSISAWVVARPDDPSLAPLDALRSVATFVVAPDADGFAGAPPPDAIMLATGNTATFERVFALAPNVEWVHSRFAGVDHVLFPALVASHAIVTSGRGAFAPALGEFVVGALLYFLKGFPRMEAARVRGVWDPFQPAPLAGSTIGIVGYGSIGRAIADHLQPFGVRIIATRRRPEQADERVVKMLAADRADELFDESDHVVAALPLTKETHHVVSDAQLARMKPHGVFINVGRGPVVDERALISVLERERIRGAALDVFEVEPLPAGHPLYRCPRLLLSPHCADRTPGWLDRATEVFVTNVQRRLRGEPLLNVVDKTAGY